MPPSITEKLPERPAGRGQLCAAGRTPVSQLCLKAAPSGGAQIKSSASIVTLNGTSDVTRNICSANPKDGGIYI